MKTFQEVTAESLAWLEASSPDWRPISPGIFPEAFLGSSASQTPVIFCWPKLKIRARAPRMEQFLMSWDCRSGRTTFPYMILFLCFVHIPFTPSIYSCVSFLCSFSHLLDSLFQLSHLPPCSPVVQLKPRSGWTPWPEALSCFPARWTQMMLSSREPPKPNSNWMFPFELMKTA